MSKSMSWMFWPSDESGTIAVGVVSVIASTGVSLSLVGLGELALVDGISVVLFNAFVAVSVF